MMHNIYTQNFYSLITPPNKEELLSEIKNIPLSFEQFFSWKTGCEVETQRLDKNKLQNLITPTLHLFLKNFDFKQSIDIELVEVWKNVYKKGCFQEIHDHADNCDFASVFFMDDWHQDSAQFYFYNRNSTEVTTNWRKILYPNGHNFIVEPKKGDILFFPSYMLHGVTPHKSNKIRTTVAFNFKFLF
jgi:uncharacterized protein (TIGR02466 family)